ncbi:hypothetical protein [Streptomyces sp. PD-S100-1]|uniref:hypothetical protein n=1 Tax=Streptomyces sp. PD-S100-1 TaxID=3394351 RepID=UPI0039BC9075
MEITYERFESAHADLWDATPLFDLRIRSGHRGRGLGRQALTWLTRYVFTEFPQARGGPRAPLVRTTWRCAAPSEAVVT